MLRIPARWFVILIASLVCLAGCQEAVATTPPPATPTPEPVVTPALPAPTSPAAERFSASDESLPAGRYTRSGFVPRLTFEVDEGWFAVNAAPGFWRIQQVLDEPEPVTCMVMFARPDGVYRAPGQLMAPTSAQAAADAISANDQIEVLETSESRMSGLSGHVLELGTAAADVQVLHVPVGELTISRDERVWLALFDTPEGLVAILVQGPAASWDAVLRAAEPVLESVTIGL